MKGMMKINDNFFVDKTKVLGKGNYGVVFKGYRVDENRIIAVKFMDEFQLQGNQTYKRQLSVMMELAKINHPNIMGFYGYEERPEGLYFFLEFCSGGELKTYCQKKISQIKVMTLFEQLLEAMVYINELNIVHRDLKPENILLDENLDLKIADFGLARNLQTQMTKGACTPFYAAPEVFNMLPYNNKCDVWSSGMILYEMLTGQEMYKKVKTKGELRERMEKAKRGEKLFVYPKQLHKNWTIITEQMLIHNIDKRASFKQILTLYQSLKKDMEKELNKKYDSNDGMEQQIFDSKKRLKMINPYIVRKVSEENNPQKRLEEESSYLKLQIATKYLLFLKMKNDVLVKIIKSFTQNPYAILKNVYKYILMFLVVSNVISRYSECVMQLLKKEVTTPRGVIKETDIAQEHKKEWEELIHDVVSKFKLGILRFTQVLEKQIVDKIVSTYMKRQEEKKILSSYENLVEEIEETRKGNFTKSRFYSDFYIKVMNEVGVYLSDAKIKKLESKDLKTYVAMRLTGLADTWLDEKNFMDEDFVRLKKQELENLTDEKLIEFMISEGYNIKP